MGVVRVDAEEREDDQEDEEVVHREGFFEQVGREVGRDVLGADERPGSQAENHGGANPDARPDGRLLGGVVAALVVGP